MNGPTHHSSGPPSAAVEFKTLDVTHRLNMKENMQTHSVALVVLVSVLTFVGCASNSGVLQVAPDTYRIATRATWELGGRAGALQMALSEANTHCQKMGKVPNVLQSSDSYGHFEGGRVDMTFNCISKQ